MATKSALELGRNTMSHVENLYQVLEYLFMLFSMFSVPILVCNTSNTEAFVCFENPFWDTTLVVLGNTFNGYNSRSRTLAQT